MDSGRRRPDIRHRDLRVGNAERERAIGLLGEHLSAGRLEISEYEARCDEAAGARYASQITPLFADLPAPHPQPSSQAAGTSSPPNGSPDERHESGSSARRRRIPVSPWMWLAVAAVIALLLVVGKGWLLPAVGVFGFFIWRGRG